MGFCFFNSVAIAARILNTRHRLQRILIVDWVNIIVQLLTITNSIVKCNLSTIQYVSNMVLQIPKCQSVSVMINLFNLELEFLQNIIFKFVDVMYNNICKVL